jgi:ketosteroid isomerase-like protein
VSAMAEIRELIEGVRQAFETGDFTAFPALLTADAEVRNPFTTVRGPDEFADLGRGFTAEHEDRRLEVCRVIESGDAAVAEVRVAARHVSGAEISFEEAGVVRVRDGRIASWHSYYDALELGRQMRALSARG